MKKDMMMKIRMGIVCLLAALTATIAVMMKRICQKELSVEIGEPFWLEMGQTAHVEGEDLSLTFEDVVNDSRCPPNVKCVWAGEVQLILDMRKKRHQSDVLCKVGPTGDVVEFDEYLIAISGVEPPMPEQGTIDELDYRIELRVKR